MAFIPAPLATVKIVANLMSADGEFAINRWYAKFAAAVTDGDLTDLAAAMNTWWWTGDGTHSYQHQVVSTAGWLSVTCTDVTAPDGIQVTVNQDPAKVYGTVVDDPLSNALSFAMTARTGLSGRSFRGRTYIFGLPENSQSSEALPNVIAEATAGALVDAFNTLPAAVHASTGTPDLVVASYFSGHDADNDAPLPRAEAVVTPVMSYGYHDLFYDFQRRRAPGHNRHH